MHHSLLWDVRMMASILNEIQLSILLYPKMRSFSILAQVYGKKTTKPPIEKPVKINMHAEMLSRWPFFPVTPLYFSPSTSVDSMLIMR